MPGSAVSRIRPQLPWGLSLGLMARFECISGHGEGLQSAARALALGLAMSGVAASAAAASGVPPRLVRALSTVLRHRHRRCAEFSGLRAGSSPGWGRAARAGDRGAGGRAEPVRGRRPAAMADAVRRRPRLALCGGPQPGLDGRIVPYPRGKVVGGSSVINALAYPSRSSGRLRSLARGMAARRSLALLQACRRPSPAAAMRGVAATVRYMSFPWRMFVTGRLWRRPSSSRLRSAALQ